MKKNVLFIVLALFGATAAFAQERIAVFPFEDRGNVLTRDEAVMFYREFCIEFTNKFAARYSVVPREDVERLINFEMAFQLSDYSAPEKTAEMQRVLNATQILSGSIGKLGNTIRVTVSLYTYPGLKQLTGGATLRNIANKSELFNKIPELVRNMQNTIAGSGSRERNVPAEFEYKVVNGRSVTITRYTGNAMSFNIPTQIQGLPVMTIGEWAFYDCTNLTSITIPTSVTTIENGAFHSCNNLTSISIPFSVTSISNWAFFNCGSLTSITVDSRNTAYISIDGVLFDKNIRTIIKYPEGKTARAYTLPSSVTSIGDIAFYNSANLTSISISPSVTSIGLLAFNVCSSLTSINIPSSVTSIDRGVFLGCVNLTSITVDSQNPVYTSIDGVLFDKNMRTIIMYPAGKTARTYTILSSVTAIENSAFSDCSSLVSITIPSSVTSIGDFIFSDCSSLTSITVDNRNPTYTSTDGVLFDNNMRTIIKYPEGKTTRTYAIPYTVTFIDKFAFNGCYNLVNITIPSSVTSIGEGAFRTCTGLTSITIPPSVNSIGDLAFYGCSRLDNITLSRRTQVRKNAFPETARITYRD